jgi:hypothetical protein
MTEKEKERGEMYLTEESSQDSLTVVDWKKIVTYDGLGYCMSWFQLPKRAQTYSFLSK